MEWATHCLLALAMLPDGRVAPAARLAGLHELPPAYLAKQLQALRRAGLVRVGEGRGGGYALARSADRITLLDVVVAVEGADPLFACTEIRRRGPFAPPAGALAGRCGIAAAFDDAERAWRAELAATTIADLTSGPAAAAGGPAARWLTGGEP